MQNAQPLARTKGHTDSDPNMMIVMILMMLLMMMMLVRMMMLLTRGLPGGREPMGARPRAGEGRGTEDREPATRNRGVSRDRGPMGPRAR